MITKKLFENPGEKLQKAAILTFWILIVLGIIITILVVAGMLGKYHSASAIFYGCITLILSVLIASLSGLKLFALGEIVKKHKR